MPGRVLLDADVPQAVAAPLRRFGHDVVTASGNADLEALSDPELLREASKQGRALVTFNVADFPQVAQDFAHAGEDHAGMILIHSRTYSRANIGAIAAALDRLLRDRRDLSNAVLYLK